MNEHPVTLEPGYMTKQQAAGYSSLSPRTLDSAKARGEIPFYRFGARKTLFKRSDLDRWLSTFRVEVSVSGVKQ